MFMAEIKGSEKNMQYPAACFWQLLDQNLLQEKNTGTGIGMGV